MVASPIPAIRPPPLEIPTHSTPTITQLESLHRQLCHGAPSGVYREYYDVIWFNNHVSSFQSQFIKTFLSFLLSGLMFISEFIGLLRHYISGNMGKNTLPEPWITKNDTQVLLNVFSTHKKVCSSGYFTK